MLAHPTPGTAIRSHRFSIGTSLRLVASAVATGIVFSGAAVAQDANGMPAHFGSMTYRLFCVGCHGVDGRGNPAVARALAVRSVDLTTIARRNGGDFPPDEVATAITGLGETGHARLKMAPWAEVFAEEFKNFASTVVVDELVDRRIEHLVSYIESIQQ